MSARREEKLKKVKELTLPAIANLDQDFADYSEKFIRRAGKSDKPFYLVHAFAKVHFDNYPAKQFKGKSPAKHPYKDAVVEIAGVSDNIPNDRYIDGIDQTSFLLSDNGESNRETVFFWMQDTYMALRWAEYKVHRKVLVTGDNQYSALGSLQNSTVVDTGYIGWVYNLYTDPQEKVSISLRKGWLLPYMLKERSRHFKSLQDYPPKSSVLTQW